MKMLMIVFRQSLEEDLMKVLRDLGVKAFTEVPAVVGAGEAGIALHTAISPHSNSIVLTALADDHAAKVIAGLHAYHDTLTDRQHGAYIPLRVFALPCEQVV